LALQFEDSTTLGQSYTSSGQFLTQINTGSNEARVAGQSISNDSESELDDFVLGALQSKILIALLLSKTGTLSSGMITKKAGISASSWAKIKLSMIDQGLLICTHKRDMSEGRVIGSVEVKLTKSGTLVAQNLLMIAGLLGKVPMDQELANCSLSDKLIAIPTPVLHTP
jgi:hypothetical protein